MVEHSIHLEQDDHGDEDDEDDEEDEEDEDYPHEHEQGLAGIHLVRLGGIHLQQWRDLKFYLDW